MRNPPRAELRGEGELFDRVCDDLRALSFLVRDQNADGLQGALDEIEGLRAIIRNKVRGRGPNADSLARIDFALAEIAAAAAQHVTHNHQSRAVEVGRSENVGATMQSVIRRAALMLGFSAAAVTGFAAIPAAAADPTAPTYIGMTPEDVGVMDRARPEYDAKGVPLGAFRLFPTIDASANYDDNVFRLPAATSDWFFEEAPAVRLKSQWGRHFLEIYGGLDNYNYATNSRLDLTDWTIGSDGRFDISRAADFSAGISYGEYHEALSSPNTVGFQASPNRYYKTHAEAVGRFQPNRLGLSVGGSYDRYDWNNTPRTGGGLLFNTDRNESEYQGFVRGNYDFSPGYSGFVKALYDSRQFDQFLDRTGVHRSSNGYRIDAGLKFQITHLLAGEVFAGYLTQDYRAPLKSVSGLDYGVGVEWFATPEITVHLNGSHDISDVTIGGVSASDDKLIKLSADYEFRRNILFQGYVSYTNSKLIGTTRTDNYPAAGISARYLINRYMSADVHYNYSERSSNFPGLSYTDDTVGIGLNLHI